MMKTYTSPGVSLDWVATGAPQTVTNMAQITSAQEGVPSINIPRVLTFKGETTKKGMRRVVLRCESRLNNAALQNWGVTFKGPDSVISAHLVVQMPETLARVDAAAGQNDGPLGLVLNMVRVLIAIASNESVTTGADLTTNGLLSLALQGTEVLDVVSGSYGSAE